MIKIFEVKNENKYITKDDFRKRKKRKGRKIFYFFMKKIKEENLISWHYFLSFRSIFLTIS